MRIASLPVNRLPPCASDCAFIASGDGDSLVGSPYFSAAKLAELRAASKVVLVYNFGVPGNHYGVVDASMDAKKVDCLDSLGSISENHGLAVLDLLVKLDVTKPDGWEVNCFNGGEKGMPKQEDGTSCGVFAFATLVHLVRSAPLRFSQQDIRAWRTHMALLLLAYSERTVSVTIE